MRVAAALAAAFATGLAVAALGGCASVPPSSGDGAIDPSIDASIGVSAADRAATREAPSPLAVAAELVAVLVQLEGHSPYDTTVQVNEPRTAFGADLVRALELAGYGLQRVDADQGRHYLAYSAATRATESGRRDAFEIRIGTLSIGREMTILDGAWVPTGPVTVRGASPQPVALNGSIHLTRPDRALSYPSGVRFASADGGETIAEALYRYAYWPTGEAKRAGRSAPADPTRFLERATGRLYEGGRTAFALRPATEFATRQTLALRFPGTSSSTLGADNRRALARLVDFVDVASDRLSIASCASDPSGDSSAGGVTGASPDASPDTSTDASTDASVARSARVKAELLVLGVPGDQVLELGCPDDDRRPDAGRDLAITIERLIDPPPRP